MILITSGMGYFTRETAYPDRCCDYFQAEDERAFEWITANSTNNSLFLTSAFIERGQFFGTDAGI